jgi:hypothetical protein
MNNWENRWKKDIKVASTNNGLTASTDPCRLLVLGIFSPFGPMDPDLVCVRQQDLALKNCSHSK